MDGAFSDLVRRSLRSTDVLRLNEEGMVNNSWSSSLSDDALSDDILSEETLSDAKASATKEGGGGGGIVR